MTHTSIEAGAGRAPASLGARFFGIITAPRATYESVVAHPRWFGMLALTAIAMALLVGGFLSTEVGREAWIEASANSPFSGPPGEERDEAMRRMSAFAGYMAAGSMLVMMPLVAAAIGGLIFAVFNAALGGDASFRQVFAVVVHAGPIGFLAQLFTIPLNYARGTMASATNLGVLTSGFLDEASVAGRMLGMIDFFVIWQLIVLSMGLAVLYRRRTQPIATALLLVYFVIVVVIAFARGGAGA